MNTSLSAIGNKLARAKNRFLKVSAPKEIVPRKPTRPFRHRGMMMRAIRGSKGIWSILARRLGCGILTAQKALRQDGWDALLEAFQQEGLTALDDCVENLFDLASTSVDDNVQLAATKFILEKTHPDYRPQSKLTIEGGTPIRHEHVVIQIPVEVMAMSVEDRMKVLRIADAKEVELTQ